jgi:molybdopterin molybdotransferase
VMQENVARDGNTIRIAARPERGAHIRRRGEDVESGAPVLPSGTSLGAYQLGLAAAVDRGSLRVAVRPRVTILATGDELRKPGSEPRAATIPESNSIVIWALATAAGAVASVVDASSDDLDETRRAIETALKTSDLVVTIGGVSVGDYDVVRPALEASGVELNFHKVAIKPGKPLTLGRKGDVRVLGLPGNPMSAQITFALFGVPLLRRLQGEERVTEPARRCRLSAPLRQNPGRRGYYPARVEGDVAMPLGGQSSGSTVSLAHAQGLVIVPAESNGYDANDVVDVFMLGRA